MSTRRLVVAVAIAIFAECPQMGFACERIGAKARATAEFSSLDDAKPVFKNRSPDESGNIGLG